MRQAPDGEREPKPWGRIGTAGPRRVQPSASICTRAPHTFSAISFGFLAAAGDEGDGLPELIEDNNAKLVALDVVGGP